MTQVNEEPMRQTLSSYLLYRLVSQELFGIVTCVEVICPRSVFKVLEKVSRVHVNLQFTCTCAALCLTINLCVTGFFSLNNFWIQVDNPLDCN